MDHDYPRSIQWSPGAGEGYCLDHAMPSGKVSPSLVCSFVVNDATFLFYFYIPFIPRWDRLGHLLFILSVSPAGA